MTPRLPAPAFKPIYAPDGVRRYALIRSLVGFFVLLVSPCCSAPGQPRSDRPRNLPDLQAMLARSTTETLGFSPGGTGSPSSLWHIRHGRFLGWLETPRPVSRAVFSPDDRLIALTANGQVDPRRRPRVSFFSTIDGAEVFTIRVDRLRTRTDTSRVSEEGRRYFIDPRVVFSPSGEHTLIGPFGQSRRCRYPFELRDTSRWRRSATFCVEAENDVLAISPDGRRIAAGAATRVHVFDAARPDEPIRIRGVESVLRLLFSANGEWLAAETWEGVKLAEVSETGLVHHGCDLRTRSTQSSPEDRDLVATPTLDDFVVRPVMAFSGSGRAFVAAAEHLCLFDLTGSEPNLTRRRVTFPVRAIAFGNDDQELAFLERFVSGYLLEVIRLETWSSRYSGHAAFLYPGAPFYDETMGWRSCGLSCPEGLHLRCRQIDSGPLMTGSCELTCRDGEDHPPEPRCLTPFAHSIVPTLERLSLEGNVVVRRRAAEHLERLINR